jgi:uncharacterized protein YjbI with pentapeptide repeats
MAKKQDHPDGEPGRHADLRQARLAALSGDIDLSHASLEECVIPSASVDELDLRGATLVDVELSDVRAVSVVARDATIRRLRIVGGRIGSLDLSGARVAELEVRDARIDYLTLAGARAEDVIVADCAIRELDLPQARLTRVAFERSQSDEIDPRGMDASHLDLRGLDALSFLDVRALRGATLSRRQVEQLAPTFAQAAGILLRE